MKLLLDKHIKKLKANAVLNSKDGNDIDTKPVVKLFDPCGAATWLLTEMEADGDTLYGLCDLGMGYAEFGNVSLKELKSIVLMGGLGIERDINFEADMAISDYADAAEAAGGRIVA